MPGICANVFAASFGEVASWIAAAIGVVVLFGVSIFVHEGGHFAAAKLLGLRADVFSIGFGPALWKRKIGQTEYRISAFPFGGYVALPQLDPVGMARIQGSAGGDGAAEPLQPALWWKRLVVAVAGPLCNVALAVPLAVLVWALPPVENPALSFGGAVIGTVRHGCEAERSGLREGDMVLKVAEKSVATWSDFIQEVHLCGEDGAVSIAVSNIVDGAARTVRAGVERDQIGTQRIAGISQAEVCGIGAVVPGSAADVEAGLKPGDTLIAVENVRGTSPAAFAAMLAAAGAPESGEAAAQGAALLVMHENALETRMVKPRFDADWRAMPAAAALVPGAVVLDTMDGFPAAGAGIKAGDAIREIGGQPVADAESAVRIIGESGGEPVEIALERWNGGEKSDTIRVTLTPAMHDAGDGRGVRPVIGANLGGLSPGDIEKIEPLLAFGIIPAPVQSYVPPWSRYHAPADQLRGDLAAIWRIFGPIFGNRHKGELGRIATSLGGPVIILSSLWSWLLASFAAAMGFMRFLNVNLAIVNLLPVPVLDGGHVVFALWRGITGHEIPPKILNAIVNAFGVAIIALFVLLSGCDAMRLYLRFGA